jgi:hypothetical protein
MIKKEPRPEPLTVTAQDIAADLHCSEATVYKLFAKGFGAGGLDPLKFGRKTLALREQLEHLIANLPRGIDSQIGVTGAKMAAANARRVEGGLPPLRTGRPAKIAALATIVLAVAVILIPRAGFACPGGAEPDQQDEFANSEQVIHELCAKEWPDDFRMRAYCERTQHEGLAQLKRSR